MSRQILTPTLTLTTHPHPHPHHSPLTTHPHLTLTLTRSETAISYATTDPGKPKLVAVAALLQGSPSA